MPYWNARGRVSARPPGPPRGARRRARRPLDREGERVLAADAGVRHRVLLGRRLVAPRPRRRSAASSTWACSPRSTARTSCGARARRDPQRLHARGDPGDAAAGGDLLRRARGDGGVPRRRGGAGDLATQQRRARRSRRTRSAERRADRLRRARRDGHADRPRRCSTAAMRRSFTTRRASAARPAVRGAARSPRRARRRGRRGGDRASSACRRPRSCGGRCGEVGLAGGGAMRTFVDLSTTGRWSTTEAIAAGLAARRHRRPRRAGQRRRRRCRRTHAGGHGARATRRCSSACGRCWRCSATNVFHVGAAPGQGQTAKLLNNLLSATAVAITSEALTLGVRRGLDPATLLEVFNAGTGRNTATSHKFPRTC